MYDLLKEFIKPELLILIPVVYLIGVALKNTSVFQNNYIPLILGCISVILAALHLASTTFISTPQEWMALVSASIVQGILIAGASVYVNQLIKQNGKSD